MEKALTIYEGFFHRFMEKEQVGAPIVPPTRWDAVGKLIWVYIWRIKHELIFGESDFLAGPIKVRYKTHHLFLQLHKKLVQC